VDFHFEDQAGSRFLLVKFLNEGIRSSGILHARTKIIFPELPVMWGREGVRREYNLVQERVVGLHVLQQKIACLMHRGQEAVRFGVEQQSHVHEEVGMGGSQLVAV
jgi:hypothetical protein